MKLNDKISGIDLDIVVTGFPGKSVCHGGLGWSTGVVLRVQGRLAVVDTGGFSMRPMLLRRFAERASGMPLAGGVARRCSIGSVKPAVLPVPVCAAPSRSRPARMTGMACAWIGVGTV